MVEFIKVIGVLVGLMFNMIIEEVGVDGEVVVVLIFEGIF